MGEKGRVAVPDAVVARHEIGVNMESYPGYAMGERSTVRALIQRGAGCDHAPMAVSIVPGILLEMTTATPHRI